MVPRAFRGGAECGIQHRLADAGPLLGPILVNAVRRHTADARVAVHGAVPSEECVAVGPCVLSAAGACREVRPVLRCLERRLGVRVVAARPARSCRWIPSRAGQDCWRRCAVYPFRVAATFQLKNSLPAAVLKLSHARRAAGLLRPVCERRQAGPGRHDGGRPSRSVRRQERARHRAHGGAASPKPNARSRSIMHEEPPSGRVQQASGYRRRSGKDSEQASEVITVHRL